MAVRNNIKALHVQLIAEDWSGVAALAETVIRNEFETIPMVAIRRTYAGKPEMGNGNGLYSVRSYLSDLISRKDSMTPEEILWVNRECEQLACMLDRTNIVVQ